MTIHGWVFSLLFAFLMILPTSAQKNRKPMTGSAAKGAASASMQVVPDLDRRLARVREGRMPFPAESLNLPGRKMVGKLGAASRHLEGNFWRPKDTEGLPPYQSLAPS